MITPDPVRGLALALALLFGLAAAAQAHPSHTRGTLANPGFEGQPMKSVFFFAGQWRFVEPPFYPGPNGALLRPVRNDCKYTLFPVDGFNHLGWSDNEFGGKRDHVLNMMLAAGVNVVNMSHWGLPSHDRWAFWAPMQSAPQANDQLFDAAIGKPMLIAPYVENSKATVGEPARGCFGDTGDDGTSPAFKLADVFPGTTHNPAPELVEQIVELVHRYLSNPKKPEWAKKWAQMYDRHGKPRYVVSLIHVGSNQLVDPSDEQAHRKFAEGFTDVANRVFQKTGVHIGFTLDVLPQETPIATFKPSARDTGPWLAQQAAVLAIQPFIPEIHTRRCLPDEHCDAPGGSDALGQMLEWKRNFVSAWVDTGIPVILDVSPGYDGKIVNDIPDEDDPPDPQYGNNNQWHKGQAGLLTLGVRGLTGNTWNGYTEGFAIVPACSPPWGPPGVELCPAPLGAEEARLGADEAYRWFQNLTPPGGTPARRPTKLVEAAPLGGIYSDPATIAFTLTEALSGAPLSGQDVRIRFGGRTAHGTTDGVGLVSVTMTVRRTPGERSLVASFDGEGEHLPIEAHRTFVVAREHTIVEWLDDERDLRTGHISVAARLTDDESNPIDGRKVWFTVGAGASERNCSDRTNEDGIARCHIGRSEPDDATVFIRFDGDEFYEPAGAQKDPA